MSPRLRGPVWPSRLRTELRREIDAAPFRRRLAEKQRRAGRRVDLVAMVHLENLDVEIGVERLRRLADERGEEIDAEAHIAGLDDHRLARRGDELRLVVGRKPGGADDMDDARLRGEVGEERRVAAGVGEVEDAVGLGEEAGAGRRLIAMPFGPSPASSPESLPSSGVPPRSTAPASVTPSRRGDDADERPPHPAGGAGNDQSHVAHGVKLYQAMPARMSGLRAVIALDDDDVDRRSAAPDLSCAPAYSGESIAVEGRLA